MLVEIGVQGESRNTLNLILKYEITWSDVVSARQGYPQNALVTVFEQPHSNRPPPLVLKHSRKSPKDVSSHPKIVSDNTQRTKIPILTLLRRMTCDFRARVSVTGADTFV